MEGGVGDAGGKEGWKEAETGYAVRAAGIGEVQIGVGRHQEVERMAGRREAKISKTQVGDYCWIISATPDIVGTCA
jgi:hypothetical protein